MSNFKITKNNLKDIANLIDSQRGNNNGKLDTQEEYSLFAQDLDKRGYKPQNYRGSVKDLVNEYITNPEKIAAQFAQNGINDKNRENRPVGYEESAEFFKGRASAFRKAIQVIHGDD